MNTPTITHLDQGAHDTRENGMCFLEAAAYLAGEKHSDHPPCVSTTIALFGRAWNDDLSAVDRDRLLIPLLNDVVGTGPLTYAQEAKLRQAVTDWFMCTWVPAWHDLLPETRGFAAQLRAGEEVVVAWDKAGSAAEALAWNAAENAAWNASRSAAGNAAWNASRSAAGNVAYDSARSAAYDAARVTAAVAVLCHGPEVLAPVAESLQTSAVEMIRGLCAQAKDMKNV